MPTSPGSVDMPMASPIRFGGVPFHPMTVDAVVQALASRPAEAPFSIYVTPNVEFVYLCRKNPQMQAACDTCFVSSNDSRMLHRIALWAGLELEFAPGAYVVRGLFDSVIEPDDPVCILGGDTRIAESLRRTFGLRRLVQHIPPMGFIRDPEAVKVAIDFVASHPSRFVMVAMGPPQSEILCRRIALDGRATGMGLCIGSSLQVLTGDINPAPEWMERSGLVWLHRLAREPGRLWRRYLVHDMVGMAICLRDVVALRLNRARAVA